MAVLALFRALWRYLQRRRNLFDYAALFWHHLLLRLFLSWQKLWVALDWRPSHRARMREFLNDGGRHRLRV